MSMWDSRETVRNAVIEVQESRHEVRPGENFGRKVKEIADSKGVKNFKVYLNGGEVAPADAPSSFREGDEVKIVPYDKAALIG